MTFRILIRRGLRFHWRAHLGVVLGAAVGSAALIGALVVGDSVRESLRDQAVQRLGKIMIALASGDRLFRSDLAERLTLFHNADEQRAAGQKANEPGVISPVLELSGTAASTTDDARANQVRVLGVDSRFWGLATHPPALTNITDDRVVLNEQLAKQLRVGIGDGVLLRITEPKALSREVTVSPRADDSAAIRARVAAIVLSAELGAFDLQASARAPYNAMLALGYLQKLVGETNRANLLLVSPAFKFERRTFFPVRDLLRSLFHTQAELYRSGEIPSPEALSTLRRLLHRQWTLDDAQLELKFMPNENEIELRTKRIFLDEVIGSVVWGKPRSISQTNKYSDEYKQRLVVDPNAGGILTYLANLLHSGTNITPYSMVAAAGPPWTPTDTRDDEILVSQWLADDLQVKPGDQIALSYFDPDSGARLIERTNTFHVRGIVPMEMPWADRTLMPDFPGIEKAESTSDWDAGFPLTYKIRQKDEDYWKEYRGTPKAFITLAAGQKMWGNRFGNLTAIRFPIPTGVEDYRAALETKILANLKPEELGLRFEPVRERALKAAEESQDFGGLFLGFSFFLIAAALLLMALLFSLGLEQRAPEIGTLLALGFTPKQVRRLLLTETVALSFLGGLLGTLVGLAYAKAMLYGLNTIWRDAVGASTLSFHFTGQTLILGLFSSVVVSVVTIWLTLRKFVRRPARELLVGEIGENEFKVQNLKFKIIAVGALLLALGLVGWAVAKGDTANAGVFFGAGVLVLAAGLATVSAWLARKITGAPVSDLSGIASGDRRDGGPTLASLGLRGCIRRRKRSLATVMMLSCGSFLIVSIGVFRLDANRDAWKHSSGTGGFALIGETTMPIVHDLNSQSGWDFFALSGQDLEGVHFVPFRVREGDEASCLNLNGAQRPRLLGVKPEMLAERFGFAKGDDWQSLLTSAATNEVTAIGDANSIQWAMHKKVGDTIDYVDERGQPFKVRIVGAVANSILQGQLIIGEPEFVKRFPGESGYRMFLIDAPSNRVSQVSATLSRALQDVGLELTPAVERLAQFNAVQNTYLGTFQVLGGLGLLLGSVGLGIVVLRNVLERRGELAVLLAVGFRKVTLQRLLLIENGALLAMGLALGVLAASVAVLPTLLSPTTQLPFASLAVTLVAVLANGVIWTWGATRLAVRGNLLAALRNE